MSYNSLKKYTRKKKNIMHISTKCSVAIHCLIYIHEYGETTKVTSTLLSKSTGINPVSIRNILSALKKDGIIRVKNGIGGATMQCPAGDVSLYRICRALEPEFLEKLIGMHSNPSPTCPVGKNIAPVLMCSYGKLYQDMRKSLQRITLGDVLADYRRIS